MYQKIEAALQRTTDPLEQSGSVTNRESRGATRNGEASELRTFLIADVQGYTRFTEEHGAEAAARLATRLADMADEVALRYQGRVIELRGDEVLAVFSSARDALHAAVELQNRVADAPRDELAFELRVGIDAGDAVPVRGGYRSGALNRAARLQSVARPGEVLASDVVVGLAGTTAGLTYLDRGEVRLKGLARPVKVFQAVAEDRVPDEVPRFSVAKPPPTNLPVQPTRFVGREREVDQVTALVQRGDVRLLTLTGPGGIGKTRLALRASETAAPRFDDGVFCVTLAPVREGDSFFQAIAQALDVSEIGGQSGLTSVQNFLRGKRLLLLLDNLEQIADAAGPVAELILDFPRLTVLATSRSALHVYGEHEYLVPPMSVPEPDAPARPDDLIQHESVRLFLDRVSMMQPGFAVTEENATSIAEICYRLDGLPLAIELAAARIKVFPPRILLARLDHRLQVLTRGSSNLPTRQHSLRDAIAWSYDLLTEPEKALFRRLSVFTGGCTLESAEAVCNASGDLAIDVMDGLASLVDKSLLRQHEGPGPAGYPDSRFTMLETIREFAAEQVRAGEELDNLHRYHAEYFLSLAERSYPKLMSAERDPWREMWNVEWDNLRSMLSWSVEASRPDAGLPMAGFLWVWCWLDGPLEVRGLVERLLAMPEAQEPTCERGWGLGAAASLAWHTGDLEKVPVLGAMALEIARSCDDERLLPGALLLAVRPDASARRLLEESRARYRAEGNVFGHGFAAVAGVRSLLAVGEQSILQDWLREALADFRRTRDVFGQGLVLRAMGMLAIYASHLPEGRDYLLEALECFRSMHEKRYVPLVLLNLGGVSRLLGEPVRAEVEFREALTFVHTFTSRGNLASCLEGLAGAAFDQGRKKRAVQLLAAAQRLRESGHSVPFPMAEILNSGLDRVILALTESEAIEPSGGHRGDMTEEEAIAAALEMRAIDIPRSRG